MFCISCGTIPRFVFDSPRRMENQLLHVPLRALGRVLDGYAQGQELVADGVGAGEILGCAGFLALGQLGLDLGRVDFAALDPGCL